MNDLATANPFESRRLAEPSAGRVATQSREMAEIQTRYLMAEQFPRDERRAMDGIINAFSRPGLAERAEYEYAKGGSDISGPSIHAAQAIAQQWGNIEFGWRELSRGVEPDGVTFSEVEAFAIDLQARVPSRIQFQVRHWRDRKSGGGYALKDEREIYELGANMAARRKRACILSVLPQDIIDAAMQQARLTLSAKADTSPAAMAKLVEAFSVFGVGKDPIEKLIQRRLDAISPAQVMRLRRIFASLRDGMSEPAEWFDLATESDSAAPPTSAKEALSKRRARKATDPPLEDTPTQRTQEQYAAAIEAAPDSDAAVIILDEARGALGEDELAHLGRVYSARWQGGAA